MPSCPGDGSEAFHPSSGCSAATFPRNEEKLEAIWRRPFRSAHRCIVKRDAAASVNQTLEPRE